MSKKPLRVLSFGAGVQSSTIAKLSITGEIEPYDHVIFADTGDEPESVYVNLEWWRKCFNKNGIEFHIVNVNSNESISTGIKKVANGETKSVSNPPLFVKNIDGSHGMLRRKCTRDYKVRPIKNKLRQIVGVDGTWHKRILDTLVIQTIGISWDEIQRIRMHDYPWCVNDYPLVDMKITRNDCIDIMKSDNHFPNPARSACWHCPYHSDEEWEYLKNNEKDSFEKACLLDEYIRTKDGFQNIGIQGELYLHSSITPLRDVNFKENLNSLTISDNECQGMCGM